MPRYKVAHLREQGQDMIIVPLDDSFGLESEAEQRGFIGQMQLRARYAGLRGTIVPVWDDNGRMAFIAPEPWHPFFRSMSLRSVCAILNRELFW